MRAVSAAMALLFLFSVVVQYNDPDPVIWMAIYGAATLCSFLGALRRLWWPGALVTGVVALAWGASIVPRVIGATTMADMFGHMGMVDVHAEEGREMLGLFLVAGWMAALVLARRRLS